MQAVTSKKDLYGFYGNLAVTFLFCFGVGCTMFFNAIALRQSGHNGSNIDILLLFRLLLAVYPFYYAYAFSKASPNIEVNRETLKVGEEIFKLSEIESVDYSGRFPQKIVPSNTVAGTKITFKGGISFTFFNARYSNYHLLKQYLYWATHPEAGTYTSFRPVNYSEPITYTGKLYPYNGFFFLSLRGVMFITYLGLGAILLFVHQTTTPIYLAPLIMVAGYIYSGWLMYYPAITDKELVLKNHLFFLRKTVYRFCDIASVRLESRHKMPNSITVKTIDYKAHHYYCGTLNDSLWLDLQKYLILKNIPVNNKLNLYS